MESKQDIKGCRPEEVSGTLCAAGKKSCRVVVSVINDLVTDQRVHKVCYSLTNAGYDVVLIGRKFRNSRPLQRPYRTYRMRLIFNTAFFFYAEFNIRLFFFLLFTRAHVLLSNDTDTLPANYLASKIRRKPLVFDAHEMLPESPEITYRKFVKSFWTGIEDWIFPKLKYCYTVCRSIADIYNQKYNMQMQVVRNIPFAEVVPDLPDKDGATVSPSSEQTEVKRRIHSNGKKILLYQGAVNMGRGIEWMINAMPLLDDYVFYIAGTGDKMKDLQEQVKQLALDDRVKFLGRIPLEDLSDYTSCADIGISLLENMGLNYYYSLPNRIFDFIRKNIPILATDFPEIRKIIEYYEVGELVDNYEPQHLATVIREMTAKGKNGNGFAKANAELTWERESEIVLKILAEAAQRD